MSYELNHKEQIEKYFPNIPIHSIETILNDGLRNDIIIINNEITVRIAKDDYSKTLLENECRVINLIKQKTNIPVPDMKTLEYGAVYYPYIHGVPLFRHKLLHMDEQKQNAVMRKLGEYMRQLHQIPFSVVKEHDISVSPASSEDYRDIYERLKTGYEKIKRELYPHMRTYTRSCVDAAFKGLENGENWFQYSPCLIHADIALEHIILDEKYENIVGIIDFGNAGTGDPAFDLGILLDNLGETFISQMADSYSGLNILLERSRIGLCAAAWHIRGIETDDVFWHLVHLMTAKDIKY
jgi:aminoglycoside 2''-phosphotransferase